MATLPIAANDAPQVSERVKFGNINDRLSEELIIAMVGPVGSGCTTTAREMAEVLRDFYEYDPILITLSSIIRQCANEVLLEIKDNLSANARVDSYQNVGNELREKFGDEYIVDRAIEKIAIERDQRGGYQKIGDTRVVLPSRRVYFLDSLKNPAEL